MLPTLSDVSLADDLSRKASSLLNGIRENCRAKGITGREVGDLGDKSSETLICSTLREERPDDAILSEEQTVDDLGRLKANRVWIIDPLDGTREFTMFERKDWAVHIALWERVESQDFPGEGRIAIGVVALPALGMVFNSAKVVLEAPSSASRTRVLVSGSRPPSWIEEFGSEVNAQIIAMGSAGAKTMEVVMGRADAYVHAGGQYEWDSAAPVGVALAAGLHASRLDGSELKYNQENPYLPDLLICRPEYKDQLLRAAQRFGDLHSA